MREIFISLSVLIIHLSLIADSLSAQTSSTRKATVDHYATVNGMKMYYTVTGKGQPLILLHGAFSTSHKDFGKIIPSLATDHQVIAIELQGHGHTNDIDRNMSYEAFAGDIVELMKQLKISKADFMGYSMGGGTALQLAITHPELVQHLVLASTAYSPEGFNMGNPDSLKPKVSPPLNQSAWKKNYDKVAPDTAGWTRLENHIYGLMGSFKGFAKEDIKNLKSPVLLIFGDGDISTPEHEIDMFRLLGGGNAGDLYELPNEQLAILPGTSHIDMVDQADLLIPIVSRFLKSPSTKVKQH